jgi:hypothetical protein
LYIFGGSLCTIDSYLILSIQPYFYDNIYIYKREHPNTSTVGNPCMGMKPVKFSSQVQIRKWHSLNLKILNPKNNFEVRIFVSERIRSIRFFWYLVLNGCQFYTFSERLERQQVSFRSRNLILTSKVRTERDDIWLKKGVWLKGNFLKTMI